MTLFAKDYAQSSIINPAGKAQAITPADSDMAQFSRALYIGVTGDVAVITAEEWIVNGGAGTVVVFKNAVAGSILPIRAAQVRSTLTTATDIVALF